MVTAMPCADNMQRCPTDPGGRSVDGAIPRALEHLASLVEVNALAEAVSAVAVAFQAA